MIKIEHLTFTYPGADVPNLKEVSLKIEEGDFVAIIGNNGCGKSTLCKALIGLIPHFIQGDLEGDLWIDGKNTKELSVGEIAQNIGYVYQDFENQIVRPTVLDDASFACLNYAMKDYEEKGRKALSMCGLYGKENEFIWQLSGGQKHLLALAGAVALSPNVLILDEPVAQLDPAHAKQIYDVLRYLNEEHQKTIIVIEHHTDFISEYCKHAILMKDGTVMWKLNAKEAMRRVEELEASNIYPPQVTVAARKLQKKGMLVEDIKLPTTLEEAKETFDQFHWKQEEGNDSIELLEKVRQEETVQLNEVTVEYQSVKGKPVCIFNDFSLNLRKGEKIALIGSNGAGKSTMMKLMIGLMKPKSGQVLIGGRDTRKYNADELSRTISLVYQNPEEMFIKDSIKEDICYAMKERRIDHYEKRALDLMKKFRLEDLADRDGRLLSGGQMRRASLAIGVALNPQILLLDEPTANLDIATRKEIMKLLKEMKDVTDTVMIATHDMQLVCEWAERVIVISEGELIADGTVDEVFSNEAVVKRVGIHPPEIFYAAQQVCKEAKVYTVLDFVEGLQKGEYCEWKSCQKIY